VDNETKIALLKDEYLLLQKFYEDYDSRIITIKGWSATIGLAAIGAGIYRGRFLWLFAAGAALVFWVIEALWKSFQYMYGPRIQVIEDAFRTNSFETIRPLQVYTAWFETLQDSGFGIFQNLTLGMVWFPHLVTIILGVILFLLEAYGVVSFPRKP
jgi:hypothetical protein